MNYCQNCYFAFEGDVARCPLCGAKSLRPIEDDDFCLLTETSANEGRVLTELMENENIDCSSIPYGSGVESQFALSLSGCRIYVPYKMLDKAKAVIKAREEFETELLRDNISENISKLHILPKTEKRILKKFGFKTTEEIIEYCANIVKTADYIVDRGGCAGSVEHYIYCYADNALLTINSMTYEILELRIKEAK